MKKLKNTIRLAIQKSGRLNEGSISLLKDCGIHIEFRKEQLFCQSNNFPLDILLVRDDDIPHLVSAGICDIGIVGANVFLEKKLKNGKENNNEIIRYFNFATCRLSIAVPNDFSYQDINSLKNCRIATSYPYLLADFIQKSNIHMDITTLSGSVEIAPKLGISDGICDLVSTGATLAANNLREVEIIFESKATLIKSSNEFSSEKQNVFKLFLDRIGGNLC